MTDTIDREGRCLCGAVKFQVQGDVMFNGFCQCKACTCARGVSPVHLIAVPTAGLTITAGEDKLKVADIGKMTHVFCQECGCLVYQCPKAGATFRAVFPTTFQIDAPDGKACTLPVELLPKCHFNYENRQWDVIGDGLPK
eukprot:CAMPEP_0203852152 /NCGR_PEP_ID=MMETSP0359-20131031/7755_1 /ASSEMBLY_ACC=CAM_ASM_000338 /TAXON_ID=268821 /ORGANISM="Scrippsiella Hangoei, Strain SHTV-5" /LENGTH=139 /DNA_ID=CAMNT_0050768253 /DNA_START=20 /DNA_END=439 /DNA_ORIENTATION=-